MNTTGYGTQTFLTPVEQRTSIKNTVLHKNRTLTSIHKRRDSESSHICETREPGQQKTKKQKTRRRRVDINCRQCTRGIQWETDIPTEIGI